MRAFRSKSVFFLLALAAIACDNTNLLQPVPSASTPPSSVAITRAAPSLLVGQSAQLAAVVLDESGNAIPDQPVAWSSSNSSIATISATGLIAGIAIGTVTVNATSGDKTASTTVSVGTTATVGDTTAGAAILPTLYPTPMPAVTGKTITVPSNGDLQAALDAAQPGDVVQLAPGGTYTGNFVLPNKNTTSSNWIIVRPAMTDTSLPPEGSRMTPQLAAALKLPRVLSPNSSPVFQTAVGAHHYRLIALEVGVDQASPLSYGLIGFGTSGDQQSTLASVPHDLVVDRSYVHGSATFNLRRCVALNSAKSAVIDSYLSDCHDPGQDAQAIAGWNGPGPFKIVNNYLEGSTENIMFGGADPNIPDLVPSDIEIRHNHITKPVAWRGGPWQIKNLLELKSAERVLIEGNVFENNWEQGQDGSAMQLQSASGGTAPWSRTWDVTIRSNIIRNTGGGIVIAAAPQIYPVIDARRFTLSNNLLQNINVPGFTGTGRGLSLLGGVADVLIAHNTIPSTTNSAITFDRNATSTSTIRLMVRDNIMGGGTYGIVGSGSSPGLASWQAWAPDGTFTNNVLIMPDLFGNAFPANNFYPTSPSAVGFTSLTGGDFRLSLVSPFKNKATDGHDIGVDVDVLMAAVNGVVIP